jgi:hypothetical protein
MPKPTTKRSVREQLDYDAKAILDFARQLNADPTGADLKTNSLYRALWQAFMRWSETESK